MANIHPPQSIDKRTGRPFGDHGTHQQALDYALDIESMSTGSGDPALFLRHWREGDLDEWPEFYVWLKQQDKS